MRFQIEMILLVLTYAHGTSSMGSPPSRSGWSWQLFSRSTSPSAQKAIHELANQLGSSAAAATTGAAAPCLLIAASLDAAERCLGFPEIVALGAKRGDLPVSVASRSAIIGLIGGIHGTCAGSIAAATFSDVNVVVATTSRLAVLAVASGGSEAWPPSRVRSLQRNAYQCRCSTKLPRNVPTT